MFAVFFNLFIPRPVARGFKPQGVANHPGLYCTSGPNRRARRRARFTALYSARARRRAARQLLLAALQRRRRLERHTRRMASLPLPPAEREFRRAAKAFRRRHANDIAVVREQQLAVYREQTAIRRMTAAPYFISRALEIAAQWGGCGRGLMWLHNTLQKAAEGGSCRIDPARQLRRLRKRRRQQERIQQALERLNRPWSQPRDHKAPLPRPGRQRRPSSPDYHRRVEHRQQFARRHGLKLSSAVIRSGARFWQHPAVMAAKVAEKAAYERRVAARRRRQEAIIWRLIRSGFAPMRFRGLADGRPMAKFRAHLDRALPGWERWLAAPWRREHRLPKSKRAKVVPLVATSGSLAAGAAIRAAFEQARRPQPQRSYPSHRSHCCHRNPSSSKLLLLLLLTTPAGVAVVARRLLTAEHKAHVSPARKVVRDAARAHRMSKRALVAGTKRRSGKIVPRVIGGTNTSGAPVTREPVTAFDGPSKRSRRP